MNDGPSTPDPIRRPRLRRRLIAAVVVFTAAGAILLCANARNNSQYGVRPLRIPLPARAGERVEAEFVADFDGHYEVEVEVLWESRSRALRQQVLKLEGPSPLDIRWTIAEKGREVAAGACEDYLYTDAPTFKRRLHDRVLGIAPGNRLVHGTAHRGVGRFEATAGSRYRVAATVGENGPEFAAARPHLCVRINRQDWSAHCGRTRRLAYAGLAAAGGAGFSLASWVLLTLVAKIRRRRGERAV